MTAASKSKDRPPAPQLGQTHERENRRLGVQCQRDAACAGVEGGATSRCPTLYPHAGSRSKFNFETSASQTSTFFFDTSV